MDYNHINSFLDRFKKIISLGQRNNSLIADIVTKHINYKINEEKIKTKGTLIVIDVSPTIKNEILIHKETILSDIASIIPERKFTDIR